MNEFANEDDVLRASLQLGSATLYMPPMQHEPSSQEFVETELAQSIGIGQLSFPQPLPLARSRSIEPELPRTSSPCAICGSRMAVSAARHEAAHLSECTCARFSGFVVVGGAIPMATRPGTDLYVAKLGPISACEV